MQKLKKFFGRHREPLMLALRCTVTLALFVIAIANYRRLTSIDMRALVERAGNLRLAAAVIWFVYAIKSVLFIIPASMIYVSVGMAFSPVSAIAVNFAGIVLEITLTYLLGRFLGGEYVEKRLRGKAAGEKVLALQDRKKFSALFLVRLLPVFPIDFVSLLLGATKLPFWKYALISLAGIMPRVALFTVLGDAIYDVIPMNLIVLIIVCCIPFAVLYWIIKYLRKRRRERALALCTPDLCHEAEAMDYIEEFRRDGSPIHGSGGLHRFDSYSQWLEYQKLFESDDTLPPGFVRAQTRFFVRKSDSRILGMINLRFELDERLEHDGGHIGYSVRPSQRRNGYASMMLDRALQVYREKGFKRVLITCASDNAASKGVIRKNHGVLENEVVCEDGEKILRYWIEL